MNTRHTLATLAALACCATCPGAFGAAGSGLGDLQGQIREALASPPPETPEGLTLRDPTPVVELERQVLAMIRSGAPSSPVTPASQAPDSPQTDPATPLAQAPAPASLAGPPTSPPPFRPPVTGQAPATSAPTLPSGTAQAANPGQQNFGGPPTSPPPFRPPIQGQTASSLPLPATPAQAAPSNQALSGPPTSPPPFRPPAPGQAAAVTTPPAPAPAPAGSQVLNMGAFAAGRLPATAFEGLGILVTQGDPAIFAVNQHMVLPSNERTVLIADPQNPLALLALMFDPPVTSFGFQRIGVQNNATLPKWKAEVIDGGRPVAYPGEGDFHADRSPRWFNFSGRSIEQVFIYADNTYKGSTWSTYNFPPIVAITVSRQ